ncbi:MAG: hypothetical protein CMJ88_13425 [Planctomycetes bacterium]|nr:hypothetical protein [Planctomycetota bacterium]
MKVPEGLRVGTCSHTGLVRGANEDDYLLATSIRAGAVSFVAAIADGMGGAAGGAEASRTALRALGATLIDGDPRAGMSAGFARASVNVLQSAAAVPALRDMGTTLTALWFREGHAVVGHIGDTRLYRRRRDRLEVMTKDHSLEEGQNLLTRCIGAGQSDCDPDCATLDLASGDRFLLCSDGVWNVVEERALEALAALRDPQRAADRLVRAAVNRGGPDNATALVIDVLDPALGESVEVELPRQERPSARTLWPVARSLRRPLWPFALLLVAAGLLLWSALRLAGFTVF